MSVLKLTNVSGINLKQNPLNSSGDLIRAVNVDPYHIGSWKKRPGFITYLGTPDNAEVTCLFNFTRNNGTQFWNYRISGGTVTYSTQGTGAWTVCGNGTLTNGAYTSPGYLEDTMMIGDGTANTRHTTNGISFTDTTSAPKAQFFTDFQNRMWAGGTASFDFYSNVGTPSDWTNDSSSLAIPGPGKINQLWKASDRLITSKNSGAILRYDGDNLMDLATKLGPSSPQSLASVEDFDFYFNRLGVFGFGGAKPEIVSNKIEKQVYNDAGSGVVGTVFDNAPGVTHRFDYLISVGSVTDDLTSEQVNNTVLVYDYRLNDWRNYSLAVRPTSWLSYADASGNQQLIFGDSGGQCYQMAGTATTDNGTAIQAILEGFIHGGSFQEKKWNWIRLLFNPGCTADVQIAFSNTFTKDSKRWQSIGPAKDGVVEYHSPSESRSRFLFYKISDNSTTSPFEWYGIEFDADLIER